MPYLTWAKQELITLTPGNVIDYDYIRKTVNDVVADYQVQQIGYDPWNATRIAQELQDHDGLPMIEFRQGYISMNEPSKEFERLIMAEQMRHGGHPILRWMASNAVAKTDPSGNIKPDKQKSTQKIDGWPDSQPWSGLPIRSITSSWIEAFLKAKMRGYPTAADRWSIGSAKSRRGSIGAVLNYAEKIGAIDRAPKLIAWARKARKTVEIDDDDNPEILAYTDAELGAIYSALPAAINAAVEDGSLRLFRPASPRPKPDGWKALSLAKSHRAFARAMLCERAVPHRAGRQLRRASRRPVAARVREARQAGPHAGGDRVRGRENRQDASRAAGRRHRRALEGVAGIARAFATSPVSVSTPGQSRPDFDETADRTIALRLAHGADIPPCDAGRGSQIGQLREADSLDSKIVHDTVQPVGRGESHGAGRFGNHSWQGLRRRLAKLHGDVALSLPRGRVDRLAARIHSPLTTLPSRVYRPLTHSRSAGGVTSGGGKVSRWSHKPEKAGSIPAPAIPVDRHRSATRRRRPRGSGGA